MHDPDRTVPTRPRRDARRAGALAALSAGVVAAAVSLLVVAGSPAAFAAQPAVGLGTARPFAVLAGTTVTNTGATVVSGDLGVSPGSAVTGFPPGKVIKGTQHVADAVALKAKDDLVTAYKDAAGRTPATTVTSDLGGRVLKPGVYRSAKAMALTGTVTLDAKGDPDAVFIFQAGSTLITASSSTVALVNGTDPCNVFWQVGSSATLRTDTTFVGTIMALTTATLETRTTVVGRVLARNGAVNLDTNTITRPACARVSTPTPTTGGPTSNPSGPAPSGPAPSGPALGGPTPTIPVGHPETGRPGTAMSMNPLWLTLGLMTLTGAGLTADRALRRRGRHANG